MTVSKDSRQPFSRICQKCLVPRYVYDLSLERGVVRAFSLLGISCPFSFEANIHHGVFVVLKSASIFLFHSAHVLGIQYIRRTLS